MTLTLFVRAAAAATVAALAPLAAAQDFAAIDRLIENAKEAIDMPAGTAVVVVKGDRIVHEGYFGYADIEAAARVDEDTVFYIASTTKALFAFAALLAEHRGDLSEDTTLQELFSDMDFASNIEAASITVKHLLTHTSGIDNEPMTWAASYTGLHDDLLRHRMVAASYPSSDAKLGDFEYTNLGYNILSVWFEDYYGQDWRETLRDTVLSPLGMAHASAFMSDAGKNGWRMAQPYSYKVGGGREPLYLRKTDSTMYAIGLIATPRDTARFIAAQLNDGVVDGVRVFPKSVTEKARRRQVGHDGGYFDGYAWGWMTGEHDGHDVRFHTGGFAGASALISYMPDSDIGLVVLHNENGLKANFLGGIISDAAYDTALGRSPAEIEAGVASQVEDLVARVERAKLRLADDDAQRLSRAWSLSLDMSAYAGSYVHPLSGEIIVAAGPDGGLALHWGNLRAHASASPERDEILVDFRPGSYDPLKFEIENAQVAAATFNGVTFDRQ